MSVAKNLPSSLSFDADDAGALIVGGWARADATVVDARRDVERASVG